MSSTKAGDERPTRRVRPPNRRVLVGALASILVVGFLLLGVFPTRTYLAQRASTQAASAELHDLEARNVELNERIARLKTKEEVERIARAEYGFVRPGEELYAILPPAPPPVQLPEVWPFIGVADRLNR